MCLCLNAELAWVCAETRSCPRRPAPNVLAQAEGGIVLIPPALVKPGCTLDEPRQRRRNLAAVAGWVNRSQQDVIEYLLVENRILREHLGGRRVRFTDAQRRHLAAAAKRVGRKDLFGIATIVTPDTLLRWYRGPIARKYDGICGSPSRSMQNITTSSVITRASVTG